MSKDGTHDTRSRLVKYALGSAAAAAFVNGPALAEPCAIDPFDFPGDATPVLVDLDNDGNDDLEVTKITFSFGYGFRLEAVGPYSRVRFANSGGSVSADYLGISTFTQFGSYPGQYAAFQTNAGNLGWLVLDGKDPVNPIAVAARLATGAYELVPGAPIPVGMPGTACPADTPQQQAADIAAGLQSVPPMFGDTPIDTSAGGPDMTGSTASANEGRLGAFGNHFANAASMLGQDPPDVEGAKEELDAALNKVDGVKNDWFTGALAAALKLKIQELLCAIDPGSCP